MGTSFFPAELHIYENSWLRLYHTVLMKNLIIYGYSPLIYSFSQLQEDYNMARYHGFLLCLFEAFVSNYIEVGIT